MTTTADLNALIIGIGIAGPIVKRFATPQAHAWVYTYHVDWDEKAA